MGWLCSNLASAAKPPAESNTLALNMPSAALPEWSASITMPAARPSGKGCCSSLMNRRFNGKANNTPSTAMAMIQIIVVAMGMTVFVTSM
ncbi:MAG: hypothetical protein BWX84_01883 [Verrucomicrobia bacterium ADurb.Bin118]|nr:MAG: hypothetical protein BWX84_01883 [Verrucomicrobia bacterium ADurb.Bin118]